MRTFELALSLGLFCCAANLNARIVTLTVGGTKTNDFLTIGTNEALTILSAKKNVTVEVVVEKDGLKLEWELATFDLESRAGFVPVYQQRVIVAGPAALSIRSFGSDPRLNFLSVEVQPDLFPPDKTLVVPQGDGANIILESSTNLMNWSSAPPGTYTNKTSNLFFRLRAERIQ